VTVLRRRLLVASLVAAMAAAIPGVRALAEPAPQTPPPTPVNGQPSPFPTDLQTPTNTARPPDVSAPGALLADLDSGAVLYGKAPAAARPVASLTKIMTALLVLEQTTLDDVVVVDPRAVYARDDYGAGSTAGLRAGERLTVEDLLYALLLGSANDAADALAIHVDGGIEAFVGRMNRRATSLGMTDTSFFSPSGLDDRGRSTPVDLLRLVRTAEQRPVFRRMVSTKMHRIPGPGDGPDRRIQNRNVLLWLYPGADGAKTGLTLAAGSCLVATATRDGRRLVAIVLGAPDEAFSDAAALLNHGFDGFDERTLVSVGEPLGSVRIRGGTVPVVAARDLSVLVPSTAGNDVEREIVVDPDAAFPPAPGSMVGTLRVHAQGLFIGAVPVVVDAVPPAPAEEGPWWVRTASTIGRAVIDAVAGLAD
jgi:D-alanyl-D-alanine carboxypeptidase (penicillin-binding protein 5/6)